jgi:hypothetical protein
VDRDAETLDERIGMEGDQIGVVVNIRKKRAPVRGWRCPNAQLYGVLGLRDLIGDTTDPARLLLRTG